MKTKILSITIFAVISLYGMAQNIDRQTIIRKDNKGIIESVEYSKEDKTVLIPKTADEFFRTVLKIQTADRFDKKPHQSKRAEFIHESFQQYYNGVKVDGGGYVFHYRNGEMYFAHGNYVKIDNLSTKPAITADDAKIAFARYRGIPLELITNYLSELIIREIPFRGDTLPMLVYKITLFANHENNTEIGFIDAQMGKVVLTEPSVINFVATGTFATRYSGTQTGITHNYNGAYHLVDSTANRAIIHTWNINNNRIDNDPNPNLTALRSELSDNDNNWTAAEHATNSNDMALDVHWALQQIRNRLFDVYKMNSFNDNGFTIEAFIRHGTGNVADNALWHPNAKVLAFGAGYTKYRPVASLDAVAHEFGHGITHFQIGWGNGEYNEGLSDIWGAIMEYRIRPNSVWQIGEQISINNSCLRNMQNTNDSKAETKMADTYGTSQYNNTSDIYVKSGVFSHWFYLLVNGGSGKNDMGNSYQVYGVGMDNAENLIVETVFNNYLRYTNNWSQIRTAFVNAAKALNNNQYGALAQQVESAWYAVGVGTKPTQITFTGPDEAYMTQPLTYTLENSFGTIVWSHSSNVNIISGQGTPQVTVSICGFSPITYIKATLSSGTGSIDITKNILHNNGGIRVYPQGTSMLVCFDHPYAQSYDWDLGSDFTSDIGSGLITGTSHSSITVTDLYPTNYPKTLNVRAYANGCYTDWHSVVYRTWVPEFDLSRSYLNPYGADQFYASLVESYPPNGKIPDPLYYWYFGSILYAVTDEPYIQGRGWPCGEYTLWVEVDNARANALFWGMCSGGGWRSYPNPASDILNIDIDPEFTVQARLMPQSVTGVKTPQTDPVCNIRLYDSSGNILRQATTRDSKVEFNVSNLLNGIYYLHIYDGVGEKPEIRQIIVKH